MSAILAQASKARLAENSREYNLFCSSVSLKRKILSLGDRPSHLGECASPKREIASIGMILFERLTQARAPRLSKHSRIGWVFCLTRRLGERC